MFRYGLSALNIWAAWSTWMHHGDKYWAILPLFLSLLLFLQQRDIDEMENFTEKDNE